MGIPVLGEIERWIQEHGSAAILEKHLAFFKDKFSLLEKEVSVLEAKNKQLIAENEKLHEEVTHLKQQIQIETDIVSELQKEEQEIIKFMAQVGKQLHSTEIAKKLGLHPMKAEHFLNRLFELDYVGKAGSYTTGQYAYWLYPKGQEYAVLHGFV